MLSRWRQAPQGHNPLQSTSRNHSMFAMTPTKYITIVDYPGANKAQEDKLNQYSIISSEKQMILHVK